MKKLIISLAAVFIVGVTSSLAGEMTISEKLEAAKKKQIELAAEIAKLEKPSAAEKASDGLVYAKRAYAELSGKVTELTKELKEKLAKK